MQVAIVGAGGIGGYLTAKLAAAGHAPALLARGAQLETIRTSGLRLIDPEGELFVHPDPLTDDAAEIGTPDLIVLAVKAHQLGGALEQIAPAVGPDTLIMTTQNGVDAPDMVAKAFGVEKTLIGVVRIFANITGPGEITRYGQHRSFVIGAKDGDQAGTRAAAVREIFNGAGIEAREVPDIHADLWIKFVTFNAVSSVTAGARTRIGTVRETPALAALAKRLSREVFDVGIAEGIALPKNAVDRALDMVMALPDESRASTAHDLEQGRALEIDHVCGSIARRGRRLGVDVTASETVAALLEPFKMGRPA